MFEDLCVYVPDWQPATMNTRAHMECFPPEVLLEPRFQDWLNWTGKIVQIKQEDPPVTLQITHFRNTGCQNGIWAKVRPEDVAKIFPGDETPVYLCEHMYHTD